MIFNYLEMENWNVEALAEIPLLREKVGKLVKKNYNAT
jgi:hypothetical protein